MIVSGLTFRGRLPSSSAAASAASAVSDMFATTEKKMKKHYLPFYLLSQIYIYTTSVSVIFINILRAAFVPIFLHQKNYKAKL
jgi:hypothetical protein